MSQDGIELAAAPLLDCFDAIIGHLDDAADLAWDAQLRDLALVLESDALATRELRRRLVRLRPRRTPADLRSHIR